MPKPQRFCIFCGGPRLSREHLFADWLRNIFPRDGSDNHIFGEMVRNAPGGWRNTRKQGHSGSRKIKTVCIPCNTGWISKIDDGAKYVVTPLVQGKVGAITPDMQYVLARWFVKISIVGDSARPHVANITPEHRRWLREHLEPPPQWQVYIGHYVGETWRQLGIYQHGGVLDFTTISGPGKLVGYGKTTFIGMGDLAVFTIGTAVNGMVLYPGGTGAARLHQIWPVQGTIDWPTAPSIGDHEADAIAHMLPNLVAMRPKG